MVAIASASFYASNRASASTGSGSWVDQSVTFTSGTMTVYATFRHPANRTEIVPGVVLIAGSGPTDRNGNSATDTGPVDTLKMLADWLSQDGVATLRYDKLGSGRGQAFVPVVDRDRILPVVFARCDLGGQGVEYVKLERRSQRQGLSGSTLDSGTLFLPSISAARKLAAGATGNAKFSPSNLKQAARSKSRKKAKKACSGDWNWSFISRID